MMQRWCSDNAVMMQWSDDAVMMMMMMNVDDGMMMTTMMMMMMLKVNENDDECWWWWFSWNELSATGAKRASEVYPSRSVCVPSNHLGPAGQGLVMMMMIMMIMMISLVCGPVKKMGKVSALFTPARNFLWIASYNPFHLASQRILLTTGQTRTVVDHE